MAELNLASIAFIVFISVSRVIVHSSLALLAQAFKFLLVDDDETLQIPMYYGMLLTWSWQLPLLFWLGYLYKYNLPVKVENCRDRLQSYAAIAFVEAINISMSSLGLAYLSAGLYAILESSSIFFSVVLTRILTKKRIHGAQYVAATFMMGAVLLQTLASSSFRNESNVEPSQVVAGIIAATLAAFLQAINGVLVYRMFMRESNNSSSETHILLEMNCFVTMFMAVFSLIPVFVISSEYTTWPSMYAEIHENGRTSTLVILSIAVWLMGTLLGLTFIGVSSISSMMGFVSVIVDPLFRRHADNDHHYFDRDAMEMCRY